MGALEDRSKMLPEGWRWARLGELAREEAGSFKIGPFGSSLKKEELVVTGTPVAGIENVLPNRFVPAFHRFISPEKFKQLSRYALEKDDVLVTTMGTIGRAAVVPDGLGPAIIDSHLFRMRVDICKVFSPYLCYAINGYEDLRRNLEGMASGAIMAGLNTVILKTCLIPLPPLAEQKRIAAILNERMATVERARAAADAQLEAAKALPAAYLRAVFDSPEAQQWPSRRLGELALIVQNGIYKTADNYGHGHPFLRMYNIRDGSWKLALQPLARVALEGSENAVFSLKTGDLLVSRVNSYELVGKCACVGPEAEGYVFENMLIRVRLDGTADPVFVAQQLGTRRVREQIGSAAKRAIGQASINSEDVRSIAVLLPDPTRQRQIAASLSEQTGSAERAQKPAEEELEAINKLPAALLRRAFNGGL
jgi:type I restriction enzyme, S subunit